MRTNARGLFGGLDEGAIDAPTKAGRLVQTSIALVNQCSDYWWQLDPAERLSYPDGFPTYVVYAIREASRGTPWDQKPAELVSIIRLASMHAHRYGPNPPRGKS